MTEQLRAALLAVAVALASVAMATSTLWGIRVLMNMNVSHVQRHVQRHATVTPAPGQVQLLPKRFPEPTSPGMGWPPQH
jgi:hypothetical protein